MWLWGRKDKKLDEGRQTTTAQRGGCHCLLLCRQVDTGHHRSQRYKQSTRRTDRQTDTRTQPPSPGRDAVTQELAKPGTDV